MSNQLTILNTPITQIDNLFSLNLVHQSEGGEAKHKPSNFLRLDTTQELIAEIESDGQTQAVKVYRGSQGGTYVCEELVLSYAMWISPKFHLIVLRAFLAMHRNQPQQLALPEPEKYTFEFTEYELQQLAWLWFAFKRGVGTFQHIERAFNVLGSNMSGQIYGQAYEYLSVLRSTNQILNRITSDFNIDPMTNWRVLKHLRGFNPKAVKIDF
ncbi:P22AR C-terminal domain-containing protein [Haemophilus influenzae]|uniref:P22AR C-terminal domain-containing protein n=1 Tax=Haemophilus influenzae TaxID=727 RepID=UPI0014559DF7|nr:P22AR C-terminal domain-containing protein [Haemophilus influenzae]